MFDITKTHPEYRKNVNNWKLLTDLVQGEQAIKDGGETYLPNPSTVDDKGGDKVYELYNSRASLYNATANTLEGLIGTAFRKAPTQNMAPSLEFLTEDADGSGLSIGQLAQVSIEHVLMHGRHGLLVDYPNIDGALSKAVQQQENIRANISQYSTARIQDWRYEKIGGVNKLVYVKLEESFDKVKGNKVEKTKQYRVLLLEDNFYSVEIHRQNDKGEWVKDDSFVPKDSSGSPWNEIPFTFIGAKNNDARIDKAPLLDLANQNIKHYQVGADWYNALHWAGQPQPVITGLDEDWRNWLEEKGFVVGARTPLLLPKDADFKLATVTADTAIQSELDKLEDRMVALGARLIISGGAAKTATEANSEDQKQHSILSLAAENVNNAYKKVMGWVARYEGESSQSVFELNTDYTIHTVDAQLVTALVSSWQSGVMPKSELWQQFRKFGLINSDKTNEDIADEIDNEDLGVELE